jgi:hypothetical protein
MGIRQAIIPLYQRTINRFPSVAPIYRRVMHREPAPPFRRRFAAQGLHDIIKREFGSLRGGVFLEAGANDGLLFSNTAYLEFYCGWRGLLIEALPHKFVECVKNRPNSIVEHCALVPPDFAGRCVELRYCNLMSHVPGLTEIDQNQHLKEGEPYLLGAERKLAGQVFLAPAKTLAELLSKHNATHIDMMVLDLEGAELPALRGMDFDRCNVSAIVIEARDVAAVDGFLSPRGFRRQARLTHHDYLYCA